MKFNNYITEQKIFEEVKQLLTELALDQAIDFAEQMHKGQFRKGDGKPYVVHPKAVYSILKSFKVKDKILLVAAWLHDTIEDTTATYNIIKKKFNKEVAELVKAVSSSAKEILKVGKEEYLLKKMLQMSNNELTLKLADRLHNISDIKTMPFKSSEKQYLQTKYILNGLREKRNLSQIQKKIIKAIERYLNTFKMDEVYMSKALGRDLDASRNKKKNKFAIVVDGFEEEEAKTIKRANTLRVKWIRYIMQDVDRGRPSKAEAEKMVTIKEL